MSLEIYDVRREVCQSTDWFCMWSFASTSGYCAEGQVDNREIVFSETLGGWLPNSFIATSENTLRSFLHGQLSRIPEVRRVTISEREKNGARIVEVWTALSKDDRDIRYRVYEVEEQIMDRFPEWLFDFHVFVDKDDLPEGCVSVYGKMK